jgi:hypothetical protein
LDGTKVLANASRHAAGSYPRAGEQMRQVELEIEPLLAKAQAADATPLQDGLSIDAELIRRHERTARLARARAEMEARAHARAQVRRADEPPAPPLDATFTERMAHRHRCRPSPLPIAAADRGTRLRNHQRSDRVPEVHASRSGARVTRMDPRDALLQPAAPPYPRSDAQSGLNPSAGAVPGSKNASGSRNRTPSVNAERKIRGRPIATGRFQNGAAILY